MDNAMQASITINGNDILGSLDPTGKDDIRIPLSGQTLKAMRDWTDQYDRVLLSEDPALLLSIGMALFKWLDTNGWISVWASGAGDRILEIEVESAEAEAAGALLDLPWEVLADKGDFLAADPSQTYRVARRIGSRASSTAAPVNHADLALMFMAAAPEGQVELDFEAEEAAIINATRRLPLHLVVEESGNREMLKDRLALDGPFDALHLSCHGQVDPIKGPLLFLETLEGESDATPPGEMAEVLGERKTPLVFLSACRTAENPSNASRKTKPHTLESYVRSLVRAGIPNVLGWDGSVYDLDARRFARTFYQELARYRTVPYGAAVARRNLLREHRMDPQKGRHWHLARVYLGGQGGGALCHRNGTRRKLRKGSGYKAFLDQARKKVLVATAQTFVGRRRQAQTVLRVFRDDEKAGALIYGMGHIGKSSLAARIANRMPRHKTVVIYGRYDSLAIFDRVVAALPPQERGQWQAAWREIIQRDDGALGDALEAMLTEPLDNDPILMIIDDLERILEEPEPGRSMPRVKDAPGKPAVWRRSLGAVLKAFTAAETQSKLLLTSRYRFTLPNGAGEELAECLAPIQLRPMTARERTKQWQAALQAEKGSSEGIQQ